MRRTHPHILLVTTDTLVQRRTQAAPLGDNARWFFADHELDAMTILKLNPIHALVVDIDRADDEQLARCRRLRQQVDVPLLMLVDQHVDDAVLTAFAFGVDDFLPKPVDAYALWQRLKVRIHAQPRTAASLPSTIIVFGPVVVNVITRQVFRDGVRITLSPKQWSLLAELVQHPNQVLHYHVLLQRIWGEEYIGSEGLVRNQMGTLRKKLEVNPSQPRYLLRAADGYQFVPDPTAIAHVPLRHTVAELIASLARPQTNVPVFATAVIGRQSLVDQVVATLRRDDVRLVTLTGPGGIGKTRLGVAAAQALADHYRDGVVFVSLAPLRDPELVLPTIAHALGIHDLTSSTVVRALTRVLRAKRLLLVLDNFEQVADAGPAVSALLMRVPGPQVLVTSRVRLNLSGEWEIPVPPLPVPDVRGTPVYEQLAASAAVQLFVARAQAAQPTFALTAATAPTVAAICQRLDGLPLAIELAAAQLRAYQPVDLLRQLENSLALLVDGPRDLPLRQQTLHATITWSYALLSADLQHLFLQLGVFVGGWTGAIAERVCRLPATATHTLAAGLDVLAHHNLIVHDQEETTVARFDLLETVQAYAQLLLDRSPEARLLRQRHAQVYTELAETAALALYGSEQDTWLMQLDREHDNVRAALVWALDHHPELALRLAGALWQFWFYRGHLREGRHWLEAALQRTANAAPGVRATALTAAGVLAWGQSAYPVAQQYLEESLSLRRMLGAARPLADTLCNLAIVLQDQGNYDAAQACFVEGLTLYRTEERPTAIARVLNNLGVLEYNRGNYAAARDYDEQALAACSTLQDTEGIATALTNLGMVARALKDYTQANTHFLRALDLVRALKEPYGVAHTLTNMGVLAIAEGDVTAAQTYLEEALLLYHALDQQQGMIECLEAFANIRAKTGDEAGAAELWGTIEAVRDELGAPRTVADTLRYGQMIALVRQRLGADHYTRAYTAGQVVPLQEVVTMMLGGREVAP